MILDNETSHLYFSEHLQSCQDFFSRFTSILDEEKIEYQLLSNTRDIWAVDYMPVQVGVNKFIQFRYQPDYLQNKKYIATQTNSVNAGAKKAEPYSEEDFTFDGGNVIKGTDVGVYNKTLKVSQFHNINENYNVTFKLSKGLDFDDPIKDDGVVGKKSAKAAKA